MTDMALKPQPEARRIAPASARHGEALVRFVDLEKTYDGQTVVVQRLNLDVRRGEFLTLLGPSGSGKTTCLMMLAGFEPWTAGDITLSGRSLRNVPAYARGIGVVFQNYALFPHMTIAQNVAYPLRQRKRPREEIRRHVDRALDMVELGHLADRAPAQLSGGQQQRVALARALVFEPDLVLMDEPLGALDRRLREQMQIEIKRLHEKIGNTVIYVTHDQGEALTMSDRIAVFNEGRIEQIATPQEIYERPATAFVANFVGDNNAIPATVRECDESACAVELPSGITLHAMPIRSFRAGDVVELMVRPELVHVDSREQRLDNGMPGDVLDVTYYGDHALLHCKSPGGVVIDAKMGLPELRASGIARGSTVHLSWQAANCRALDPTGRPASGAGVVDEASLRR